MWEKVTEYMNAAEEMDRNYCQIPKYDINKNDIQFLNDCGIKTEIHRAGYIRISW